MSASWSVKLVDAVVAPRAARLLLLPLTIWLVPVISTREPACARGAALQDTCESPVAEAGRLARPYSAPGSMLRPRFVLFGDSLTQRSFDDGGWGSRLASAYQRKVDVVLRGYSGYTTRWVKPLLPHVFPEGDPHPPLLTTVFLGANDAAIAGRQSARQHVPLEEYSSNLQAIVAHMQRAGVKHILVMTPPPLDEARRIEEGKARDDYDPSLPLPERSNEVTAQYAAAAKQVAGAAGVPVLDLFNELQKDEGWQVPE